MSKKVKEKVNSQKSNKNNACQTCSNATNKPQLRQSYTKKAIRVEMKPDWLGEEYVAPVETDEVKKQRKELELLLKGFKR